MQELPKKLEIDAIAEVVFAIQLKYVEENIIPELIIGKLAENPDWREFEQIRLPVSDIPVQIRAQDSALEYEPIIELRDPQHNIRVRLGHNIISYHIFEPYVGWDQLSKNLEDLLQYIFDNIDGCVAKRTSLRYVNIFTEETHRISNITDLNLNLTIATKNINEPQMINFLHEDNKYDKCTALVRIASSQFVGNQSQRDINALIDIDIFSSENVELKGCSEVISWLETAHNFEKQQFFRLLKDNTIKHMEGDPQ